MALLEVKGLTLRFGGLTAVNKVDFQVEQGQIYSVIGPNGAGKTTVFNAITGIYEPAEGGIRFDGRELRRPFRRRVVLAMALVGLMTSLAFALFASGVDGLWRAALVLNTPEPGDPFPLRKAAADARAYLYADLLAETEQNRLTNLEVRPRGGKFEIRSRGNRALLETFDDEETANRRLDILRSLVELGGSARTVEKIDGKWLVTAPGPIVLGLHGSEAAAREQARALRDLPESQVVEREGAVLLVKDGRTLARFGQRFEAEDHKAAMAFAKEATVEKGDGRFAVLDDGRRRVLETHDSREKARERLLGIAVAAGKLRWRIVTRAAPAALGFASTPAAADEERRAIQAAIDRGETPDLGTVGRAQARERVVLWIAILGGFAIGAGGAWVVWNRARRTTDFIARSGLARTFQNIRLFPDMLVVENVLMGMDAARTTPAWKIALNTAGAKAEEAAARGRALELLAFVGLEKQADRVSRFLAYGDQRRLEIARALATGPRLLLLDEPAAGMNPAESVELMGLIRKIRDRGITVLLIEHHMKVVMGISDRIAVLQYGSKIAEGTPEQVRADPKVVEAYLGKEEVG